MPRALPWNTNGSTKTEKPAVKRPKPAARHENEAEEDLVNSDLEPISKKATERKRKPESKRTRASSSSPPPPGPPPVETMRPGFAADDIFMMVEDEFYSTAQLYTGHIHHAEYTRLKKLHRSRGQETLAGLGRGTDGKTEQSKALRMKMESLELAKKQKQTLRKLRADEASGSDEADGSEAEDEYMQDPTLSGLMKASQMAPSQDLSGLVNPKANTRAAASYSQSPYKAFRTKDVLAEDKQSQRRKPISKVDEDEDESDDHDAIARGRPTLGISASPAAHVDSETDEDDLDAGVPSEPREVLTSAWQDKVVSPITSQLPAVKIESRPPSESRPFATFARPTEKHPSIKYAPGPSKARSSKLEAPEENVKTTPKTVSNSRTLLSPRNSRPVAPPIPPRERKYSSTLARKRAERAAAEAQRRSIKKEDIDDIPTFLF